MLVGRTGMVVCRAEEEEDGSAEEDSEEKKKGREEGQLTVGGWDACQLQGGWWSGALLRRWTAEQSTRRRRRRRSKREGARGKVKGRRGVRVDEREMEGRKGTEREKVRRIRKWSAEEKGGSVNGGKGKGGRREES
jgi:hypothetical protein